MKLRMPISAVVAVGLIGWASVVRTVAGTPASGDQEVKPVAAAAPPAVADVLDADPRSPVHYQAPQRDLAELIRQRKIVVDNDAPLEERYRFASADAAAKWFADARPVVPRSDASIQPLEQLRFGVQINYISGGVAFDADKRPWVWTQLGAVADDFKRQVEEVAAGKRSCLVGCKLLLIDRQQRVWVAPERGDGLLGFDPRQHTWIDRKNLQPEKPPKDRRDSGLVPKIVGHAYESRSGMLFFGDQMGVHVFDGKTWTFQKLYQRNIDEDRYDDPFHRPRGMPLPANSFQPLHRFAGPSFSEDSQGRVYSLPYGVAGTQ